MLLEMGLGPEVNGASYYGCCLRVRNPEQETPSVKRRMAARSLYALNYFLVSAARRDPKSWFPDLPSSPQWPYPLVKKALGVSVSS